MIRKAIIVMLTLGAVAAGALMVTIESDASKDRSSAALVDEVLQRRITVTSFTAWYLLAILVPLIVLFLAWRRYGGDRPLPSGNCKRCGHKLARVPGVCPECGTKIKL